MKLLVVFDGSLEAEKNLKLVLDMALSETNAQPVLMVCVPELLCEDKPLDDFLGEMEAATAASLQRAKQLVAEVGQPLSVSFKVVQGMELDGAGVIARQARQWQADQIYLSVGQECASYLHTQAIVGRPQRLFERISNRFNQRKPPKAPDATPAPVYSTRSISASALIPLAHCPVTLSYEGKVIFSLQTH